MIARLGPYELLEEIARGGSGVVYRARDEAGRALAVKVLLERVGEADPRLRRFQREAEALATLRHRNVVPIHSYGYAEGRPYLVLDFVPGRTLQEVLEREGPLEPRRAAELTRQLADALEHAHARGVVHRDVKPANVLLTESGEPVLTDFGLAAAGRDESAERLTRSGVFFGTPGYWSPEQARGQLSRVGPASDVYSLGATLYASLTGVPPLTGDGLLGMVDATLNMRPTPPSGVQAGVDAALQAICLRCLEKSPRQRYASAQALADDLADYLAGRAPTRRRRSAGLLATGGLALLGLALSWPLLQPPPASVAASATPSHLDVIREAHALRLHAPERGLALLDGALRDAPADLDLLGARGRLQLALQQLEACAADVGYVLQRDPNHFDALVGRAALRALRGQLDGALEDVQAAVEARPDDAEAWRLHALIRIERGEHGQALSALDQALALDPERAADVFSLRIDCHRARGEPEAALDELSRFLSLSQPHGALFLLRAELEEERGRLDAAQADYVRALEHDPALVSAWWGRGRLRFSQGDLAGALADLDRAIELDGSIGRLYSNRGAVLAAQERYMEALAEFDRALGLDPRDLEARQNRGIVLVRLARAEEAVAELSRVVAAEPARADAWAERGMARQLAGDLAGAEEDLTRALALRESASDHNRRGAIRALGGDYARGLEDFRRATELDPSYADALQNRARACEELGRVEEALESWTRLLEVGCSPEAAAEAHRNRGVLRGQRGDLAGATADLERAAALAPDDLEVRCNLAVAFAMSGQPERAAEQLAAARALGAANPASRARVAELSRDLEDLRDPSGLNR